MVNALDYAKASECKLFIYLSTVSIHGEVNNSNLQENTAIITPNIYGSSKFLGEKILHEYSNNFPTLILRLPGVIGSHWQGKMPWINNAIDKIINNQDLYYYNSSSLFNNVIDVNGIFKFLNFYISLEQKDKFQLLNFSASQPIKLKALLDYIINKTSSKTKLIELKTDKISFKIDVSSIKRKFNYENISTIEIIDNYLKNENLIS